MGFKVTIKKDEFETVDAPSRLEPGWYRAILDDAFIPDGKEDYTLVWKCIHGPFNGAKQHDFVSSPERAASHGDGGEFALKRIKSLAKRMGLVKPKDVDKEFDAEFSNAIGLEFAIRVVPKTIIDPNDPHGKKRIPDPTGQTQLDPMGVYPLTHEAIPPAERLKMGLELLPGQVVAEPKVAAAKRKPAAKETVGAGANGSSPPAAKVDLTDL